MTAHLKKRIEGLERKSESERWSLILVMCTDDRNHLPFSASVRGVEGKIVPYENEGMISFYHRLQVIDHLRKRPEDISDEEMDEVLRHLAETGQLKTPKPKSGARSPVSAMEFEDE